MTAFTESTIRQLARAGFTDLRPSEYFRNCVEVRDEDGNRYGHFTESEARRKLLKMGDEEVRP